MEPTTYIVLAALYVYAGYIVELIYQRRYEDDDSFAFIYLLFPIQGLARLMAYWSIELFKYTIDSVYDPDKLRQELRETKRQAREEIERQQQINDRLQSYLQNKDKKLWEDFVKNQGSF